MVSVLFFVVLGAVLGAVLGYASRVFQVASNPLVDQIEALMPGGQCGQCGEAGCRQAAQAMADGRLSPNACPLGGSQMIQQVADLLGVSVEMSADDVQWVAIIEEAQCSGCGRCYKACPFDAIVGATKQMHTVIRDVCTGCKLCTQVCPQQCLTTVPLTPDSRSWFWPKPQSNAA